MKTWIGIKVGLTIEIKKNRNDQKSNLDYIWQLFTWSELKKIKITQNEIVSRFAR